MNKSVVVITSLFFLSAHVILFLILMINRKIGQ